MQRQVTKRQVQVIQPTVHAGIHQSTLAPAVKKRVAAYARVSTEHEEQQSSYEAQVDYYTRKITERSGCRLLPRSRCASSAPDPAAQARHHSQFPDQLRSWHHVRQI